MRKYRPYQREAAAYCRRSFEACGGAALFMQMRLGKTLVAIREVLRAVEAPAAVLVVTPLSTIPVWQRELQAENLSSTALVGSSKQKLAHLQTAAGAANDTLFVLVNPEGLRACPAIADECEWSAVILDESGGWFRSPRAQITKLVQKKFQGGPLRLILTGEPQPSGPEDYVEQLRFVLGGEFMGCRSFWDWRLKYMAPDYCGGWSVTKKGRRLTRAAVKAAAFRLTAKQAGITLPRIYQRRYVTPPPEIKRALKECRKDWTVGEASTKWVAVAHGWQSQLAGGIIPGEPVKFNPFKLRELVALAAGELKRSRFIVWARFTREVNEIRKALKKAGRKCEVITGKTPVYARGFIIRELEAGSLDCVIIQSQVGQYALKLSFADAQIFYSNVWDWGIRTQQEARTDEVGKAAPSLIVDLISEGTLDEAVLDTLQERRRGSAEFAHRVLVKSRKGSR